MKSELRAGIDIGTNTILLLIAEVSEGRIVKVIEDHVRVVRLGQGVDSAKNFIPEAMNRARACFSEYRAILDRYPGILVRAIATSGSRDAQNSSLFFSEIKSKFNIEVSVISGEEEARICFQGALTGSPLNPESTAVIDIGGGSTEIVALDVSTGKLFKNSFDFGCVRMTERFLKSDPPAAAELNELEEFISMELRKKKDFLSAFHGKSVLGVAGTATYLASSKLGLTKFIPEKVQGSIVQLTELNALLGKFSKMRSADRLGIGGMDAGRADVIVSGAIILEKCMSALGVAQIQVSTQGLRYGVVLE